MRMTSLTEYNPLAGELVEFRTPAATLAAAAQAPVHPAPPSHLQENHLRRRLANASAGRPHAPWLGIHFDLPGRADTVALAGALTAWIRRHPTLLTWFAPQDGGFRRHAVAPETVRFTPVRLGGEVSGADIRDHLRATLVPATDPTAWPPLMAAVVLRPTHSTVVLAVDHAHTDALSLQHFYDELRSCYAAELAGTDADLPEAGSYVDFCRLDRNRAARIDAASPEVARWADFLRGGRPADPVDLGTEPGRMYPSAALSLDVLTAAESDAFARTCKASGAGFSAGMLAALALCQHRLGAQDTYRALTVVHTRDEPRWERAHGWFVNAVPVEFPVGERPFADLVSTAQNALVRARGLSAVTPMRLVELLPELPGLQLDASQTLPLVSYVDFRHASGSREWAARDAGFLLGEGRVQGLHIWVNRLWDRTYMRIEHPDTPLAREGARRLADGVRQVMHEAAGTATVE